MKKKVYLLLVSALLTFGLVGCSNQNVGADSKIESEKDKEEEEIESTDEEEVSSEEESESTEEVEESSEEEEESTSEAEESTSEAEGAENMVAPTFEGTWIDFDNMCFAINGKVYTLGQTTLQEMIDDGVPFKENDIANANNNLNPNYESSGFDIVLGDYYSAQVSVLNDTDENKTMAECYISEVYYPVHQDKSQDILGFTIPMTVTMEELVATCGEPDETSHYDGDNDYTSDEYKYIRESTKYYSKSYYRFEFIKGELSYFTMQYMP